eukprot:754011-Hanusia_phi.AAC.1
MRRKTQCISSLLKIRGILRNLIAICSPSLHFGVIWYHLQTQSQTMCLRTHCWPLLTVLFLTLTGSSSACRVLQPANVHDWIDTCSSYGIQPDKEFRTLVITRTLTPSNHPRRIQPSACQAPPTSSLLSRMSIKDNTVTTKDHARARARQTVSSAARPHLTVTLVLSGTQRQPAALFPQDIHPTSLLAPACPGSSPPPSPPALGGSQQAEPSQSPPCSARPSHQPVGCGPPTSTPASSVHSTSTSRRPRPGLGRRTRRGGYGSGWGEERQKRSPRSTSSTCDVKEHLRGKGAEGEQRGEFTSVTVRCGLAAEGVGAETVCRARALASTAYLKIQFASAPLRSEDGVSKARSDCDFCDAQGRAARLTCAGIAQGVLLISWAKGLLICIILVDRAATGSSPPLYQRLP